jgi:hypothetical protein
MGTPAEYRAGLEIAIARGWLMLHESGTYVKFTAAGPRPLCLMAATAGNESSRIRYRFQVAGSFTLGDAAATEAADGKVVYAGNLGPSSSS